MENNSTQRNTKKTSFDSLQALPIEWSAHAVQRADDRFDVNDITPPEGLFRAIGARKRIGERFRIRFKRVVYVLARQVSSLVVVTVMFPESDAKQWARHRRKMRRKANS